MATATRPPPVNREYYAEPTQACPLTTGDLGHPLHISTFRTFQMCCSTFALPGMQTETATCGE